MAAGRVKNSTKKRGKRKGPVRAPPSPQQKAAATRRRHATEREALREKRAEITLLERRLYAQLKNSPEYARCLATSPSPRREALQAAKASCEGFQGWP